MQISILSKSGPLIFPMYFEIEFGVQVHSLSFEPKYPHGHGFMLAANIKLAGYVKLPFTLETVTCLSSNAPLRTSNVLL